jgi:hypothetical protein
VCRPIAWMGLTPRRSDARSLCLFGAAAAGVPAIDAVYTGFRDLDRLRAEARAAVAGGFSAMAAVHPGQVGCIKVFAPGDEAPREVAAGRWRSRHWHPHVRPRALECRAALDRADVVNAFLRKLRAREREPAMRAVCRPRTRIAAARLATDTIPCRGLR